MVVDRSTPPFLSFLLLAKASSRGRVFLQPDGGRWRRSAMRVVFLFFREAKESDELSCVPKTCFKNIAIPVNNLPRKSTFDIVYRTWTDHRQKKCIASATTSSTSCQWTTTPPPLMWLEMSASSSSLNNIARTSSSLLLGSFLMWLASLVSSVTLCALLCSAGLKWGGIQPMSYSWPWPPLMLF